MFCVVVWTSTVLFGLPTRSSTNSSNNIIICYSRLGGNFLGACVLPTGSPKQVLQALQQVGAKFMPNDACSYSFMGVFCNDQELTTRKFIYMDDDPECFARVDQVSRLDFMRGDQGCEQDRKPLDCSYQKDTKMLYIQSQNALVDTLPWQALSKADFKTPHDGHPYTW